MDSNGSPSKSRDSKEIIEPTHEVHKKFTQFLDFDASASQVRVKDGAISSLDQSASFSKEPNNENSKMNPLQHLSNSESSTKDREFSDSPLSKTPKGLDHCITAPAGTHRNLFLENHADIAFSRSMTERRETPRHDLKLDRLSEREKKKLIVNLVKIQNDGTVEVDLTRSNAPVASELLEFQSVEGAPSNLLDYITTDSLKSIPKLKIAVLVVGTRGDVQPFLAVMN